MGGTEPGDYAIGWAPPQYTVDDRAKVVGGYSPREPNNWGRWGEQDERGTQNLIGPHERIAAARLVCTGKIFSLALPMRPEAPVWPPRPASQRLAQMTGSPANAAAPGFQWGEDILTVPTHWDGLGHAMSGDSLHNGFSAGNVTALGGARVRGVDQQRESFVGRGVLIDAARLQGLDVCPDGQVITPAMLDGCLEAQGVELRSGDILLVRTGYLGTWWTRPEGQTPADYFLRSPGISREAIGWLHERGVSALATDTAAVEVLNAEDPEDRVFPLYVGCVVDLGLTLGELFALDELASDCAQDGTYEFLLAAQPLHIPSGMGSPLNPIALR